MPSRFCPKCGALEGEKPFMGVFCLECYLHDHPDIVELPSLIELDFCPTCLKVRHKGSWVDGREENVHEAIIGKLKTDIYEPAIEVALLKETAKGGIYKVHVAGSLEGHDIELEDQVEVRNRKRQCEICAKKQSTYHEAIIQLRPKGKDTGPEALLAAFKFLRNENRMLIRKYAKAEIFRFKEGRNGIDIYFGSMRAAKVALQRFQSRFSPDVKETYTLVGINKKTGKPRHTVTYSVRI